MEIRRSGLILVILILQWIFAASLPCIGETEEDLAAIRELLLTLERGYEEGDVEKYVSVFSEEEYEYSSDMATPDDPGDDPCLTGAEGERRLAIRFLRVCEHVDLEMTDPDIEIDGNSAEARNEYWIVIVIFKKPNKPEIVCAGGKQTFSMKKSSGEWKIVRWQQYELTPKELAASEQWKQKPRGVEDPLQALGDDRLHVWATAMMTLGKKRDAVVASLIKLLSDPDRNVRIRAAKVLYGTQDEDAMRELIGILEDEEEDVDVRAAAAVALSECDSRMVDAPLLEAAKRGEPELGSAAALALAKRIRKEMDDAYQIAAAGLLHTDETVREAAIECLGNITSARGVDLLEQRLRDRNESENVRLAALESLKQIGSEPALSIIRNILRDKTEAAHIRINAALSLDELRDPGAVELLMDVARDEEEELELRGRAVAALGAIGNPEVVEPLIQLLSSPDERFRCGVVESLARLKDSRVLDTLMKVLMNMDESIYARSLAGRGILRIDRDTAFGPLAQIVKDRTESAPARQTAASILTSFRDERAVPIFIEILKDENQHWRLRRIAVSHLKKFAGKSPLCVDALRAAADCPDERIAMIAQEALGEKKEMVR